MQQKFKAGIYTLGCRVNQYESEAITELLRSHGAEIADFSDRCDVYIINTCAVTEESVRKSRQIIRRAIKSNPDAFVAVCGCASQLEGEELLKIEGVSLVCGSRNKSDIAYHALNYIESGVLPENRLDVKAPVGMLEKLQIDSFSRIRAYVKIEDGCNFNCSYCIIPTVRGRVALRDREDIINEVKSLAESGCREVVLTGIETSAYGKGLAKLLSDINEIDGIERIRLGSLYPSFLDDDFTNEISSLKKVAPHFHISIQSGSDRILRLMRRGYTAEDIVRNTDYMRKKIPNINFSSDIIVGFPNETEADYLETEMLIKRLNMLHTHIFTYSKRPGTPAASMEGQIPENVKSERSARLHSVQSEIKNSLLSAVISEKRPLDVLFEQANGNIYSGHTPEFFEVSAESEFDLRGQILPVLPEKISGDILSGKLIK